MATAVIVDAVRTPWGHGSGSSRAGTRPTWPARRSGAGRAQRPRPGPDRRRDHGLCHAGRRARAQHRPQRGARLPACPSRCRPPPSTVSAAPRSSRPLRGPGRDRRRVRHGRRRRRRDHDRVPMGAVDRRAATAFGPRCSATRPRGGQGARAPGHLGRAHRREVGPLPGGPRRLRARSQQLAAQANEGRYDARSSRQPRSARQGEGRPDRCTTMVERRRGHPASTTSRRSPSSSRRSSRTASSPPATPRRSPTARPRCSS